VLALRRIRETSFAIPFVLGARQVSLFRSVVGVAELALRCLRETSFTIPFVLE